MWIFLGQRKRVSAYQDAPFRTGSRNRVPASDVQKRQRLIPTNHAAAYICVRHADYVQ